MIRIYFSKRLNALTKKHSKPHNNKITEKTDKPKEDKLKEKDKKKCKTCKKDYNAKCPLCNSKRAKKGDVIGDSTALEENIFEYRKIKLEQHPWYYEGKLKNGKSRRSIEAHHLITSEILKNNKDTANTCDKFGYNINHFKNGVMLPYYMDLACLLAVPLHRGGHSAGTAGRKKYPQSIKEKVEAITELAELGDFCKSKIKSPSNIFIKKMDNLSSTIFKKIKNFDWTITSDGINYKKGNSGCGNAKNIGERKGKCKNRGSGSTHKIKNFHDKTINIKIIELKISK